MIIFSHSKIVFFFLILKKVHKYHVGNSPLIFYQFFVYSTNHLKSPSPIPVHPQPQQSARSFGNSRNTPTQDKPSSILQFTTTSSFLPTKSLTSTTSNPHPLLTYQHFQITDLPPTTATHYPSISTKTLSTFRCEPPHVQNIIIRATP